MILARRYREHVLRRYLPAAWGHWRLPVGLELVLIAAAGAVMLALAIAQFNRTE